LQSVDFAQAFQSDLPHDSVLVLKYSCPFIHICGLDGCQHVLVIKKSSWISCLVRIFEPQDQKHSSIVVGLKS